MIRVLIVLGGPMRMGGTEAFLMNYYRNIDRKRVQFDFVYQGSDSGVYDNEILSYGGRIFHIPYKSKSPLLFDRKLKQLMKRENYKIVHGQMDAMNAWVLWIAKRAGVPIRISHSHNTNVQSKNILKVTFNNIIKLFIPCFATDLWACSGDAGMWLYGNKKKEQVVIIRNAIDPQKFSFSESVREVIRKQYEIDDDTYVVGNVGRLSYQKNHRLLLKAFSWVCKTLDNVRLMIVGDGDLRDELENLADELGVRNKVIFTGNKKDAYKYYNAMDLFVFPSWYEGLSITFLEAQVNGLFCICSDGVTKEGYISDALCVGLNDSIEKWGQAIKDNISRPRSNNTPTLIAHGYDIHNEAEALTRKYEELLIKHNESI